MFTCVYMFTCVCMCMCVREEENVGSMWGRGMYGVGMCVYTNVYMFACVPVCVLMYMQECGGQMSFLGSHSSCVFQKPWGFACLHLLSTGSQAYASFYMGVGGRTRGPQVPGADRTRMDKILNSRVVTK